MEVRNLTTIAPVRIPYLIDGEGYILRKASYAAVQRFKVSCTKLASIDEEGNIKPKISLDMLGMAAEADCDLLASCLHHAEIGEDGRILEVKSPVTMEELKDLPNDAVAELIDTVKKISQINPEQDKEALSKQLIELTQKIQDMGEGGDPLAGSPTSGTGGSVSPEPSDSVIDLSTS